MFFLRIACTTTRYRKQRATLPHMQRVFDLRTQVRRAIVSDSLVVAARKQVTAQNIFSFPFCVNQGDLSFRGVVLEFFEVSVI